MRILYDHQTFTLQEYGGISRYFFELMKEFQKYPDVEANCSLFLSNNDYIRGGSVIPHTRFLEQWPLRGKRVTMLTINKLVSAAKFLKQDFDVFHPTYYDPYFLRLKSNKPFVVTCLDLIHERFMADDVAMLAQKKTILNRADLILAISNSTKNDLIQYYSIPENKIKVTHLATSVMKRPDQKTTEQEFFLFVGNRSLYKNFDFFITAISPLLHSNKNLSVLCAGGGKFTATESALLQSLKVEKQVQYRSGSDEMLTELYSTAMAFFYPSRYEGFGIPILEAMACGCPVVCSNVSSLPEVAGNAALYFEPENQESILNAAQKIYADSAFRNGLREKGYERASNFSWAKTARVTYDSYKTII